MRTKRRDRRPNRALVALAGAALAIPLAAIPALPAIAAPVAGQNVLYTLDADFDQGVLQDVNHDSPNNDQLQLDKSSTFFPYVNVAASQRGTMVRIDVNTGAIVGEWYSAPEGAGATRPGPLWTSSATPGCPTATSPRAARDRSLVSV